MIRSIGYTIGPMRPLIGVAAVMIALVPCRAEAQLTSSFTKDNITDMLRKVGVHLNTSFRNPLDPDVTKGTSLGASIGLSPGQTNGWRYPFGLTMFTEHLHSPTGQEFAVLRTRALLAGIGYGWHFGRLSTGVSLQTGLSVNSALPRGDVQSAFGITAGTVSVDAGNALLVRPEVKAEYFIKPKFTVRVSADYMLLRPDVTVTTPAGQITDQWDASNIHANIGFGVYPFRK